ncbi:hypothetical protein [Micromonospora polyrhachis]|uniref:Uncharacterized protein n=1 Tax=Micromonospora polyrhachis TaxID=1282883 RepID=A0A7W7SXC3_9ACTN|nr:hypothetical protein [Micromonospora polyrhachis]MBB4961380.1 hypothetical protein [Micromonospora polyrhachis]
MHVQRRFDTCLAELPERVMKIEHKLGAWCGIPPNPEPMTVAVLSDLLEVVPVALPVGLRHDSTSDRRSPGARVVQLTEMRLTTWVSQKR